MLRFVFVALAAMLPLVASAAEPPTSPPTAPAKPVNLDDVDISPKEKTHYEAIDARLAMTMIDPTSPIQYEISDLFPCKTLGKSIKEVAKEMDCACYYINAKNQLGAYVGKRLGFALIAPVGSGFVAMDISELAVNNKNELLCAGSGLKKRDSAFIRSAAGVP